MAWIESHTVLMRHRKLREFARSLRIRPSYAMGHLHALWHAALEQREDGDLSGWSDEFIAEMSDYPGDAPQYVRLLQEHGWLDGKLLHDWLDYAGLYLTKKYNTSNKERLIEIWAKHGREYGVNGQRAVREQIVAPPNPPNLDQPTITFMLRIGGWFKRRPETQWSEKEVTSVRKVMKLGTQMEDLASLESYYTFAHPKDRDYRRRDIQTLLNNWNGEVDRAKAWKATPAMRQARIAI